MLDLRHHLLCFLHKVLHWVLGFARVARLVPNLWKVTVSASAALGSGHNCRPPCLVLLSRGSSCLQSELFSHCFIFPAPRVSFFGKHEKPNSSLFYSTTDTASLKNPGMDRACVPSACPLLGHLAGLSRQPPLSSQHSWWGENSASKPHSQLPQSRNHIWFTGQDDILVWKWFKGEYFSIILPA